MIVETKSELDKKKSPDLSKLNVFGKFAKIKSKGFTKVCVTEACVTEAKDVTESKGDTKEMGDVMELKKKKPLDLSKLNHNAKVEISKDRMELKEKRPLVFSIDYKVLKTLVLGYNAKMTIETKSELDKKKQPDLDKLDHNAKIEIGIVIKLPEEEKMGKVS